MLARESLVVTYRPRFFSVTWCTVLGIGGGFISLLHEMKYGIDMLRYFPHIVFYKVLEWSSCDPDTFDRARTILRGWGADLVSGPLSIIHPWIHQSMARQSIVHQSIVNHSIVRCRSGVMCKLTVEFNSILPHWIILNANAQVPVRMQLLPTLKGGTAIIHSKLLIVSN